MDAKGNTSEFSAYAGFFNIETTLDWARDDAGLLALVSTYNVSSPITFRQLKAVDLSSIPESDFRYTLSPDERVITNVAVQPYQLFLDANGSTVDVDGKEFWVIKTF